MDVTNPPPGGGTPLRGNRSLIIASENKKLKFELIELRKLVDKMNMQIHELKNENMILKREITTFNTNKLDSISETDFQEMDFEQEQQREDQQREKQQREKQQRKEQEKEKQQREDHQSDEESLIDHSLSNAHEADYHEFVTDEEELERETNWILNRRKNKNSNRNTNIPNATKGINEEIPETSVHFTEAMQNPTKEPPPPPINVIGVHDFSKIQNILKIIPNKNYKIIALNNDVWKINTPDSDSYRALVKKLKDDGIQWYTFENKQERPLRVMIRGLHPTCKLEDIIDDLKQQNFQVEDVVNMIKKVNNEETKEKIPLPLFMVSFSNTESADRVYNIRYILNVKVKIEAIKKNAKIIPQCKRCQGFNHTQRYCSRDPRCVSCAGKHLSSSCLVNKSNPPTCVNCKGNHPANYRGCEVAKELTIIRKQALKSKQSQGNVQHYRRQDAEPRYVNTSQREMLSYAQVTQQKSKVNNNNDEQQNQDVSKILLKIEKRLEEQNRINEIIFNSLKSIEERFLRN